MIKNIIKPLFFFFLCFVAIKVSEIGEVSLLIKGYTLSFFELFWGIFLFWLIFELIILSIGAVIAALKKDVLVSNHDYEEDKKAMSSISSTEKNNKIVLSRSQFDEAAILIVKTMSSLSLGLQTEALRHLVKLRKIVGDDAIVDILMLKIYKKERNFDKIEQISQKLMKNENIQLVGMKAALEAQIEKKEFTEALKTVNQAFEVRQDLYWVISSAFLLRAKTDDWLGALEVLEAGIDKDIIPPQKAARLKAVALFELAMQAKKENDMTKFFKFITQALQENKHLVPAALTLADYYVKNDNQIRKAEKVLCSIWCENPTYDIAMAYLNLFDSDTKVEKIQRMERLALLNTKCPSLNNLILAELYTDAKKMAKARSECHLFLLKNPATQKIASMLEKFEEKPKKQSKSATGIVDSIKSHLTFGKNDSLKDYPKDFQWVCANCGHKADDWQPICPECGEIGRYYWQLYVDKEVSINEDI